MIGVCLAIDDVVELDVVYRLEWLAQAVVAQALVDRDDSFSQSPAFDLWMSLAFPGEDVEDLRLAWRARFGVTGVNPPYGEDVRRWLKRAVHEAAAGYPREYLVGSVMRGRGEV